MVYKRLNLGFNSFINKRFMKKFSPKIPYHKQYETRDFIMKNNIDLKNFKNYYETGAFKNYKPNLKR
tara:strand:- start:432 stop:632 length:201 start_codon:yes stop_codon:yes gene_type:complete